MAITGGVFQETVNVRELFDEAGSSVNLSRIVLATIILIN